ncbi:hypothetical protein PENFLA_c007G08725 [Penicillium flavigenum]|uniref:Uncharacterized protein n=1 Tax=Penicillium flavigenum TaxID=254877 RepID=A0A1V6TIU9_9EURO|nr:hypothetical protein PENFLA_c007G08725 [Penicillium flavigenum]
MAADSDYAMLPTTILRMYDSFGHFKLADDNKDYWLFEYGKDGILPGIFVKSSLMIAYGGEDVAVGTADAANIVIYPKTGETEWGLAIVQ